MKHSDFQRDLCEIFTVPNRCLRASEFSNITQITGFELSVKFISILVIGSPLLVLGITVNIVNLVIFSRHRFIPITTRRLLQLNAVVDNLLLTTLIFLLYPYVLCGDDCRYLWLIRSHAYGGTLVVIMRILRQMRNWLVVIISGERWLLVCHPIIYKRWWNQQIVARGFAITCVITLVTTTPYISAVYLHSLGREQCQIVSALKGLDAVIMLVFHAILPSVALILCTIAIVCETTRQQYWQLGITKIFSLPPNLHMSRRNMFKLHRALTIALFVFVILTLPLLPHSFVIFFMHVVKEPACVMFNISFITLECHHIAQMLQASVNFFVYLAFWDKFRHIVSQGCNGCYFRGNHHTT